MILNRQRRVRLDRALLGQFLRRLKNELGLGEAAVTICLVSDAAIAKMNQAFRKEKGPTDVLSFPAVNWRKPVPLSRERTAPLQTKDLGDIAISPETARRNAKKHGRTLANEMRVLILHGVLHLLGYDHETDHGQMNRLEHRLRRRLELA